MDKNSITGKPVILFKYGGNAMIDEGLKKQVLQNICNLKKQGYDVVIVHGGGPFIKHALEKARIESEFIDGHRKTTREAFEYVEMALKGKVNGNLVSLANTMGFRAVGLSGKDGRTVIASKRIHNRMLDGKEEQVDLGQVGNVAKIDPRLIQSLLKDDFIPVITCIADDLEGNGFNINADIFAGHMAGALKAEQYIVLTDVDGLLKEKDDPSSLIRNINLSDTHRLLSENIIQGGMIPKVESCEIALNSGAKSARIINGTRPGQINDIINNQNTGTLIHS